MATCGRCGRATLSVRTSYFNTDDLCPECQARERAHPRYAEAVRVENGHVRAGDYNFAGIGAPPELSLPQRKTDA